MFWNTIYRTTSLQDVSTEVIRMHGIGNWTYVVMEMQLGALTFNDPNLLAICDNEHAREVAELFSKKLGLPIEQ